MTSLRKWKSPATKAAEIAAAIAAQSALMLGKYSKGLRRWRRPRRCDQRETIQSQVRRGKDEIRRNLKNIGKLAIGRPSPAENKLQPALNGLRDGQRDDAQVGDDIGRSESARQKPSHQKDGEGQND